MDEIIKSISDFVWGLPMIFILVGLHLFLTLRLRFPQRHLWKAIKLSVTNDEGATGDISHFSALTTSLAATIGTGNIIGVATAIVLGGPGAVFWCWFVGIFAIATKYAEGLLAVKYRVQSKDGRMLGGPMYALERGLGMKWLAVVFAVCCAIATFGIGNLIQSNAIAEVFEDVYGVNSWVTGIVVAILVGIVLLGGVKVIGRVCKMTIPFMVLFYIGGCIYLMILNVDFLWPAIKLIVTSAFAPKAIGGGMIGAGAIMAMRYGVARGLNSNESGMGSAPILAAAAKTPDPVRQALVSSTATFWDTVVICALTGLTLVSTILHFPDLQQADGAALAHMAFGKMGVFGQQMLAISIVAFAFSTLVGWSYYGERSIEYLGGARMIMPYRLAFVLVIIVGCNIQLLTVWNLTDIFNAMMLLPNAVSLLLLSKVIADETRKQGYL
ncbi:MAG: sodium:alanine symporter family protein [Muribaculaceae bacterium]|nr:sodium:alanine symporter family protein [Muribaculaceae bacterium]